MEPTASYPPIESRKLQRAADSGHSHDRLRVKLAAPLNEAQLTALSQELRGALGAETGMHPLALRRDKRGQIIVLDLPEVSSRVVRLDQLCEGLARQGSGLGPARGIEVIEMIGQRIGQAEQLGPITASAVLIEGDAIRWFAQTQPFLRYLMQPEPPQAEPNAAALARLYVQLLTGDPAARPQLLPDPRPRLVELLQQAYAGQLSAMDFAAEASIELPSADRRGPRWAPLVSSYLPPDAPIGPKALFIPGCFRTEAVSSPTGNLQPLTNPVVPTSEQDSGWSSILGDQPTAVRPQVVLRAPPTLLDQPAGRPPPTLLDRPDLATGDPALKLDPNLDEALTPSDPVSEAGAPSQAVHTPGGFEPVSTLADPDHAVTQVASTAGGFEAVSTLADPDHAVTQVGSTAGGFEAASTAVDPDQAVTQTTADGFEAASTPDPPTPKAPDPGPGAPTSTPDALPSSGSAPALSRSAPAPQAAASTSSPALGLQAPPADAANPAQDLQTPPAEPRKSALPLPESDLTPTVRLPLPDGATTPPSPTAGPGDPTALAALNLTPSQTKPPPRFDADSGRTGTWIVGGVGLVLACGFALWTMRSEPPAPPPNPPAPAHPKKATKEAPRTAKKPAKRRPAPTKKRPQPLVSVLSEPTGAAVEVNGARLGKTPLIQRHPLRLDRSYLVRVTLEGHDSWQKRFWVNKETNSLTVKAVLAPQRKRRRR